MYFNEYPISRGYCGDEINPLAPGYYWGGANPRKPLSQKERARRKVRRQMAKKSRKINRR